MEERYWKAGLLNRRSQGGRSRQSARTQAQPIAGRNANKVLLSRNKILNGVAERNR